GVPVWFSFAEVRPIGVLGVIARVFKRNTLHGRVCKFLPARRCRQRRQCISKARRAVRHAVQDVGIRTWSCPAPVSLRSNTGLSEQMFAASFRALQDTVRSGVAMQTKKTEDRAGTT